MTKAKSNVMTDFGAPIIVLVLICVIMSGLLAFTNGITAHYRGGRAQGQRGGPVGGAALCRRL